MLEALDPTDFDQATTMAWATGVEQLRRQAHAAGIAVADHLDVAQPFRDLGFFTAKNWMKYHLQLSGSEAHSRVQEARLRRAVAVWNNALAAGQVGVAQTRLMARIAANPRIEPDVLVRGVWELMVDAMDLPYIEFERRALTWEMLADPDGAADQTRTQPSTPHRQHPQNPDGSWSLHALFDDVGGPEFLEIFCWYVDREFDQDWKEAVARLGDGNVDITKLRRTETQRRADALLAMARAAATNPPGRSRPLPTVNFLLDENTAAAVADNQPLDPSNYRTVDLTHRPRQPHQPQRHHRRLTVGTHPPNRHQHQGRRHRTGRTQRLFTGHAREAVMLLEPTCIWPGCDQPHTWCHADHLTSWTTRGPTNPHNGAPLCPRHNYLKETGFTIWRDHDGHWHITAPDGTTIC